MKIFSEELVEKAVKELHIANLAQATIGDVLLVAQYLEKETGIPFIRMDQGSPGLAANQIGIDALIDLFVNRARLALNDGEMFGKEGKGFMRMNVATPRSVLKEALERLVLAAS